MNFIRDELIRTCMDNKMVAAAAAAQSMELTPVESIQVAVYAGKITAPQGFISLVVRYKVGEAVLEFETPRLSTSDANMLLLIRMVSNKMKGLSDGTRSA